MFARNWLSSARPLPALLGTVAFALTVLAGPAARAQTAPAQQPAAAPTTAAPATQADAQSKPDAPKPGLDKNGLPTSVVKVAAPPAPPKDPDAVEPPRTDGPIDDIIITAPQFGNREEVEAFHKAEFERLDKIYGKHEEKRSRGDTLTKAPESNTGTTRDGPITLDR
ncbi:hypothetical protein [Nitrospirillum viridazoti]|uniref:Uncharacterized protein n=1 Tax=Nitrospirillum viridazoti CBAmc TaxID=1441467 RepID=A0A248JQR7_9PROT|nr:hypothetical protein [Nitrospirillum amazonense]ASG20949.1 hypothetical protein Y958_09045 [Nitrospirillum amazonense CBAmc]